MTSLWADTLPANLRGALGMHLEGDKHADVAIVGGGYTGLWTAYFLQQQSPHLSITVVDAHHLGFGASGRNGGWASALFPASIDAIAQSSGRDAAVQMYQAMHSVVDELLDIADHENWDIQATKGGTLVAARSPLQLRRAEDEIEHWRSWGFGEADYRLLSATEAKHRLNATDVVGATFTPHCAAIHPARLVRNLAATVTRNGAEIFENSPVTSLEPGIIRTAHGTVRAPIVVRATEGYTASLPRYRRTLAPVYSLMIATEPLEQPVWDVIGLRERETFSDGRHLIIYGQRTADDRIAFGGRGAPYHFGSQVQPEFDRDPDVFAELWRTLTDLFPVLAQRSVTHTWGGPLGVPRDWYASCGIDRSTGVAWSGGYVGDGVGTSLLGGHTLADLILGHNSPRTQLPWVNHRSPRWEPEPLRWLGTNVGLRTMTSADDVESRTGKSALRAKVFGRLLGH
jgi:glycine/D-amino acid oxidase-like deaminating enzyme